MALVIQQTEWPDTKLTRGERVQLAVGFAINDAIAAVVRVAGRLRP